MLPEEYNTTCKQMEALICIFYKKDLVMNNRVDSKHIALIDYLKAFAAILVIINHFGWDSKNFPLFTYLVQAGVPIFLFLSGFNTSLSYNKRNYSSLKEYYYPSRIWAKLKWIFIPYAVIYVYEAISKDRFLALLCEPIWLIRTFLAGGIDGGEHGGYYICIYWQFILVAPLLYLLIKKLDKKGLLIILLLNILYEYSMHLVDIDRPVFRLLFFRYLFLVGFGMYFYFHRKIHPMVLILMFLCGYTYTTAVDYQDFRWVLNDFWRNSCVYAIGYFITLIVLAFYFFEDKKLPNPLHQIVTLIGHSSFHIFLMQMLYYRTKYDNNYNDFHTPLHLLINVVICLILGCIWYSLEKYFRKEGNKAISHMHNVFVHYSHQQ